MFAYIRGNPVAKASDYVVIDVGGVGYKLFAPLSTLRKVTLDDENVVLHTHLHVREDDMTLYGFAEREDLQLFELLLSVSGIGPKVALSILSNIVSAQFYSAILANDIKLLTTVPGIGKKTAQRLVLELKEKISKLQTEVSSQQDQPVAAATGAVQQTAVQEALAALQALGYDYQEALAAVQQAREKATDSDNVQALIRIALQSLAIV